MHSTCPEDHFERKKISEIFLKFYKKLSDFQQFFLALGKKTSTGLLKMLFTSLEQFGGKNINLYNFLDFQQTFVNSKHLFQNFLGMKSLSKGKNVQSKWANHQEKNLHTEGTIFLP